MIATVGTERQPPDTADQKITRFFRGSSAKDGYGREHPMKAGVIADATGLPIDEVFEQLECFAGLRFAIVPATWEWPITAESQFYYESRAEVLRESAAEAARIAQHFKSVAEYLGDAVRELEACRLRTSEK